MKRILGMTLGIVLVLLLVMSVALADEEKQSGAFTYRIKGNGTAVITGYEGKGEDVYVPRMLDGYSVSEIGENVFSDVGNVIVTLPDTITTIGSKAFENSKVTVITIPESVRSIGDFAFFECDNIRSVFIPASVEFIGVGAFAGCDSLLSFSVGAGSEVYATIDNCLFNKQKKELVSYPKAMKRTIYHSWGDEWNYNVPSGIESIGPYAFYTIDFGYGNSEIPLLPDTIKSIGEYAFYGTSYQSADFHLPANLESIGDYAFAYSSYPKKEKQKFSSGTYYGTEFYFPRKLERIGDHAFEGACMGLVHFGNEGEEVCLTTIGEYAFMNASLFTEVRLLELPSSVEKIGRGAFKDFDDLKGETSIFYKTEKGTIDLGKTKITTIEPETFSGVRCGHIYFPATVKEVKERAAVECAATLDFDPYLKNNGCLESIGDEAFLGVTGSIMLPTGKLKTIGDRAFYGASNFRMFWSFDSTLISIGKEAFGATGLTRLIIPASVTKIGENFCDREKVILTVEKGSYAEQYALENGYQIKREESNDTSWLND